MNLYRAIYSTKAGRNRRMTFAACDAIQAQRIALGVFLCLAMLVIIFDL